MEYVEIHSYSSEMISSSISVYYQNCGGIRTKTQELLMNILSNNYDVIVLVETWLVASVNTAELVDSRYTVFRRDRDRILTGKMDGGGVLVAVRKELAASRLDDWENNPIEQIFVSIPVRSLNLIICAVYIPPVSPATVYDIFSKNLENVFSSEPNNMFCVLGDLNLPSLAWSFPEGCSQGLASSNTAASHTLLQTMSLMSLIQYNCIPNHNNKYLDLIFYSREIKVARSDNPLLSEDRHHPALEFDISSVIQPKIKNNKERRRNFRKADYTQINNDISCIDWKSETTNLSAEEAVDRFYVIINNIIDKFIPVLARRNEKFPVWFTPELIRLARKKDKVWLKWKTYKGLSDYREFSFLRTTYKKMSSESRKLYFDNIENSLQNNIKSFWSYISSLKSSDGYPAAMSFEGRKSNDAQEICNMFSDFFKSTFEPSSINDTIDIDHLESVHDCGLAHIHTIKLTEKEVQSSLKSLDINKGAGHDGIPAFFLRSAASSLCVPLTIIFNKCLSDGVFPDKWKLAYIIPVHKGDTRQKIENYRPISILSAIPKLLERLVHDNIYPQLAAKIIDQQHGFVKGKSTMSNLLIYSNFLFTSMDRGHQVDAIYCDFKKAFDKVDHLILIKKIIYNGIRGNLLRWFVSYLTKRQQAVSIRGHTSMWEPVTSGVPQGSILGPLLFILFINTVAECFIHCLFLLYADDIKIFAIVRNLNDSLLIQRDLVRFEAFCNENKIYLSYSKCKQISFTKNHNAITRNYYIGNYSLERVYCIRDLGILFDSKLHFDAHIENIVNKAYCMLGFVIRNSRVFRKPETYLLLYYTLVRSQLEYCTPIWTPLYGIYKDNIESVQKKFLHCLNYRMSAPKRGYTNMLSTYKVSALSNRRTYLDLMTLYKICNNFIDCPDLLKLINFKIPPRTTRVNDLFHIGRTRTNAGVRDPIRRMCELLNQNQNLKDSDIFFDTYSTFSRKLKAVFL